VKAAEIRNWYINEFPRENAVLSSVETLRPPGRLLICTMMKWLTTHKDAISAIGVISGILVAVATLYFGQLVPFLEKHRQGPSSAPTELTGALLAKQHYDKGISHFRGGSFDKAIEEFDSVLKSSTTDTSDDGYTPYAHYYLVESYLRVGDCKSAQRQYLLLQELDRQLAQSLKDEIARSSC
jgi:hypothetical protein